MRVNGQVTNLPCSNQNIPLTLKFLRQECLQSHRCLIESVAWERSHCGGNVLTPPARFERLSVHLPNTMGQQLNKYIKRKRRAAYLKRKKEKVKAAKKK